MPALLTSCMTVSTCAPHPSPGACGDVTLRRFGQRFTFPLSGRPESVSTCARIGRAERTR